MGRITMARNKINTFSHFLRKDGEKIRFHFFCWSQSDFCECKAWTKLVCLDLLKLYQLYSSISVPSPSGAMCPSNCPTMCKMDEVFCPGSEDDKGCRLPDMCLPKSKAFYKNLSILIIEKLCSLQTQSRNKPAYEK